MPRATNKPAARHRKKKILKQAKGYRQGRSRQFKRAREFGERALTYAFRDRRQRKRDFRALWIARISAACKQNGTSYSRFMDGMKKLNISLNRKILAEIAHNDPERFVQLVERVKEGMKITGAGT
jgi:large subunit ribosomal protein L20